MKTPILAGIIFLILCCLTFSTYAQIPVPADEVKIEKLWETPELLTTSESVCYDPLNKVLYVSCINGNPVDKDKNGFISILSLNGEIVSLKWIDGLNAPKGMGISGNKLYVTDVDLIVEIDIPGQVISNLYFVENAKFLNDIAIDKNGNVYASDYATSKIHRINNGIMEIWLQSDEIKNPNGLFYEDNKLIVGTGDGIYSIRLDNLHISHLIDNSGGIDGLKPSAKEGYIISDWKGKIQWIRAGHDPVILINTTDQGINAADFEYIQSTNSLYVPTFSNNRVVAYELEYE